MKRLSVALHKKIDCAPAGKIRFGTPSRLISIVSLVLWCFLSGCGSHTADSSRSHATLFVPNPPPSTSPSHIPAFYIADTSEEFNRIGEPRVVTDTYGKTQIIVSVDKPVVYYAHSEFTTASGSYHNIIYRIHFSEVPFGWGKFNLTAGNNPGLLFIYTFDTQNRLLLITTVHTCGCYLAFLPTQSLPRSAYPADWPDEWQEIYGQTLPAKLEISANSSEQRLIFRLESETHRITDVFQHDILADNIPGGVTYESRRAELRPIADLYRLPYHDDFVSFFETSGSREGYVKNNTKWLERLVIGWWAFDFRVGEDKAYGGPDNSDTPLYTSLKFWAREESDLKNFASFLSYWGWKL